MRMIIIGEDHDKFRQGKKCLIEKAELGEIYLFHEGAHQESAHPNVFSLEQETALACTFAELCLSLINTNAMLREKTYK